MFHIKGLVTPWSGYTHINQLLDGLIYSNSEHFRFKHTTLSQIQLVYMFYLLCYGIWVHFITVGSKLNPLQS
jgi:hypothetical protein